MGRDKWSVNGNGEQSPLISKLLNQGLVEKNQALLERAAEDVRCSGYSQVSFMEGKEMDRG